MIELTNGSKIQPIINTSSTRSERAKYATVFCKNCNTTHHMRWIDLVCVKGEWYCRDSIKKSK